MFVTEAIRGGHGLEERMNDLQFPTDVFCLLFLSLPPNKGWHVPV